MLSPSELASGACTRSFRWYHEVGADGFSACGYALTDNRCVATRFTFVPSHDVRCDLFVSDGDNWVDVGTASVDHGEDLPTVGVWITSGWDWPWIVDGNEKRLLGVGGFADRRTELAMGPYEFGIVTPERPGSLSPFAFVALTPYWNDAISARPV